MYVVVVAGWTAVGWRQTAASSQATGPAGEAEGGGTWFQSDRISMSCASITRD
jgi:hypothetical protein